MEAKSQMHEIVDLKILSWFVFFRPCSIYFQKSSTNL